jgi:transcriptional regulator with XRE-family HTH domain
MEQIAELSKEQARIEREKFIEENQELWSEVGLHFKNRRLKLGITIKEVAERLGTSPKRISAFEMGAPVSMPKHLERTYDLALEMFEIENMDEYDDLDEDWDDDEEVESNKTSYLSELLITKGELRVEKQMSEVYSQETFALMTFIKSRNLEREMINYLNNHKDEYFRDAADEIFASFDMSEVLKRKYAPVAKSVQ